ncbi:sugar phosphate isomerase/epimerase [Chromohalobacter sp. HP20-39]|uniref:sugar phosphate isomerase/epimerase family protein n=1 Tax=Chromohalobacter sp. HP20-39 TaxID=3079306 RepID=UPI00294AB494|nr:sugar phosphate isomerase/epimerase [Chromohalobacter sp. HP20-39]MDV6318225.1 sugar phosphate isomerase/epimerase [Chromohalobacter sp. HP20-39]
MTQPITVSTAAFDGYELPEILASLARCHVNAVEIAFIKGYVNEFTDADLHTAYAREIGAELTRHGQYCPVFSGHIDLGLDGALSSFAVRARFAAELGASHLITNSAARQNATRFFELAPEMAAIARDAGLRICLENPGDGSDNLFNDASDITPLLERLDRNVFGINYDPGNVISHRPGLDPVEDAMAALSQVSHLHLKAVTRDATGYAFGALGTGDIDYVPILAAVAERSPTLPFSLELPFRLRRDEQAQPHKFPSRVPLADIEEGITSSLSYVTHHLSGQATSKEL